MLPWWVWIVDAVRGTTSQSILARFLSIHPAQLLPVPLRQVFLAEQLGALYQSFDHARLGGVVQHGLAGRQQGLCVLGADLGRGPLRPSC